MDTVNMDNLMNLDQHVISLENAKKLKELGVERESVFVWVNTAEEGLQKTEQVVHKDWYWEAHYADGYDWTEYPGYCTYPHIPAYLASEVLEMLPYRFNMDVPEDMVFPQELPATMAEANDRLDHMDKLPNRCTRPVEVKVEWAISRGDYSYFVSVVDRLKPMRFYFQIARETLSDALAETLIYLLDNNLITKEEING